MARLNKMTIAWTATVAAGASNSQSASNDYQYPFVIQSVCFAAFTTAAIGSNIPIGTPWAREMPNVDLAIPSLSHIELDPEFASQKISNLPWNALLDTGDGRNPAYCQTELTVPPGGLIKCLLQNNHATLGCKARLVFNGYLQA